MVLWGLGVNGVMGLSVEEPIAFRKLHRVCWGYSAVTHQFALLHFLPIFDALLANDEHVVTQPVRCVGQRELAQGFWQGHD